MTLGWVCVFVSCIWRESSPPWQSLKTTSSTYILPRRERSFLYPPRQETDLIYHQRSQMKRAACLKYAPSSTALSSSLCGGLCVNLTQVTVVPLQKIPKVNKTLFFCILFYSVECETSPRDLLANWQHKHSRKAARMVYFFWAVECSLKRDKDGSAYRLPSKWHFAASFRRLDVR